jgi:hypothetical protein
MNQISDVDIKARNLLWSSNPREYGYEVPGIEALCMKSALFSALFLGEAIEGFLGLVEGVAEVP